MLLIKLLLILLGVLLGSLGGSINSSKGLRRIGIPGILTLYAIINLFSSYGVLSLWTITIMFISFILSIGHGIPDINDEGSVLGRFFFWKVFKGNNNFNIFIWTDICVRGTIALLFSLCLLSIPVLKGNWITYILCSLGIILSFSLFNWRNWGFIKFKDMQLLKSDIVTYGLVMLFYLLLI